MKTLFITLFIIVSGIIFAQSSDDAVLKKIPERSAKKIVRADKLLHKGDEILKGAVKYDDEIASFKEGHKKRKVKKLTKKSDKIKLKAAPYLKDGYKNKAKTLKKLLKESMKVNPQLVSRLKEKEVKSNKKIKEGKKLYRKADDASSKKKSIELYEQGHTLFSEAIDGMMEGLEIVYDISKTESDSLITDEPKEVQEQEIISEEVVKEAVPSEQDVQAQAVVAATATTGAATAAASAAEKESEQKKEQPAEEGVVPDSEQEQAVAEASAAGAATSSEEAKEESKAADVFFTIQFIADKKPVTDDMIRSKYSGEYEVVKIEADGWYRYSAGRFVSIEKAKEVMQKENIKGFIVAYKNGQRITIKKAIELLK